MNILKSFNQKPNLFRKLVKSRSSKTKNSEYLKLNTKFKKKTSIRSKTKNILIRTIDNSNKKCQSLNFIKKKKKLFTSRIMKKQKSILSKIKIIQKKEFDKINIKKDLKEIKENKNYFNFTKNDFFQNFSKSIKIKNTENFKFRIKLKKIDFPLKIKISPKNIKLEIKIFPNNNFYYEPITFSNKDIFKLCLKKNFGNINIDSLLIIIINNNEEDQKIFFNIIFNSNSFLKRIKS